MWGPEQQPLEVGGSLGPSEAEAGIVCVLPLPPESLSEFWCIRHSPWPVGGVLS